MNNYQIMAANFTQSACPDKSSKEVLAYVSDPNAWVHTVLKDALTGPFGEVDINGCDCEAFDGYTLALGQAIDAVQSLPYCEMHDKATSVAERETIVSMLQDRLDDVRREANELPAEGDLDLAGFLRSLGFQVVDLSR